MTNIQKFKNLADVNTAKGKIFCYREFLPLNYTCIPKKINKKNNVKERVFVPYCQKYTPTDCSFDIFKKLLKKL